MMELIVEYYLIDPAGFWTSMVKQGSYIHSMDRHKLGVLVRGLKRLIRSRLIKH